MAVKILSTFTILFKRIDLYLNCKHYTLHQMSNSYVSGCGATVEIMEGCEARFDLRLSIEEIKIVIMGLKKRLKKAKTEKTINKFQLKIDELEDLLANLPEKAPWQRELDTGLYNS